ncbi:MAG: hypothetical protein JRG81_00085 [Deltaproteobacteria bacterium]|nr:hypothetical protein [Deltaproteobacteria bacterium]MBW2363475.1 hypothetical protein [Deltaproteobacteria bacterium]
MNIKTVLGSVVILISIVTAVVGAEKYLAKASELHATNLRLDYKINRDIRNDTATQIYDIEKQYGTDETKMPEIIRKRYRDLKDTLKAVEKALEQIRNIQLQKGS